MCEDIEDELRRYGDVKSMKIPRPTSDQPVSGVGKVFVEYASIEQATAAKTELNGRQFASRTILVDFFPVQSYQEGQLD